MNLFPKCFQWFPCQLILLGVLLLLLPASNVHSVDAEPTSPAVKKELLLHVPSPDWRDQVVYFLMIDRFNDGDPSLNDQGYGLYRPNEEAAYSGGDLQGVIDKLDYIQALGATTIWTTPPFANQWWSDSQHYGGYHGYWPRDFTKVDEHYGSLETYQNLSHELHSRDMYLIMDIVVNHVGNYFEYDGDYTPNKPTAGYIDLDNKVPTAAPGLSPFDLNDANNPEHLAADIYHWTPSIKTFEKRDEELSFQLGGLDDINTSNPRVRETFKQVFADWIKQVGIDGYRIDTVKYVEPDFWVDFLHSDNGVHAAARQFGRDDFWVFGEVKESSLAFNDIGERKMQRYFSNAKRAQFDSLINFPLQEELVRVLGEGAPTSQLSYRLRQMQDSFPDITRTPNFMSNHDVPRFGDQASEKSYQQALALLFTLPGVPVLYQGDEQNLLDSRQAMFAGGYLSPQSHFDTKSPMYRYIQSLTKLREEFAALRRGDISLLHDNSVSAGAFVFRRDYKGQSVLVAINTAAHEVLASGIQAASKAVTLKAVSLQDGQALADIQSDIKSVDGQVSLKLAPRAIRIFEIAPQANAVASQPSRSAKRIQVSGDWPQVLSADTEIAGYTDLNIDSLQLLINGDLSTAQTVPVNRHGQWQARIEVSDLGQHEKYFQLYSAEHQVASDRVYFTATRDQASWQTNIDDPKGDDRGPSGDYRLPSSDSFDGQQDILGLRARGAGDVMELTIEMNEISDGWLPVNGFDHVAFTILFDFAGASSGKRFEELNYSLPVEFSWSHANVLFGWGNYLISYPEQKLGLAPAIKVNKENRTVTLTYKASDFGQSSWRGTKVLTTTWDRAGEGALRPLTPKGAEFDYRGDPNGAKVMDSAMLTIER